MPMRAVDETVDLVAVQADDELINALASGMAVSAPGFGGYDADDHVTAILAAWRAEVDQEPIPELVDIDTAIAAIKSARPRSRARHLAPVAAAAAFVVLAVGGVTIGSSDAKPGDALWAVSKVLYSERAGSIEAAARVETRIDSAKKALMDGQSAVAAQELAQAAADLPAVRPEEGQAELSEVQTFLAAKADETPDGTPTDPGEPLQRDRQRRVPEGAVIGKSPATPTQPTGDPSKDPSKSAPGSSSAGPGSPAGSGSPSGPGSADPRLRGAPASSSNVQSTEAPTSTRPRPTATPTPSATPEGGPSSPSTTTPQSLGSTEGTPDRTTSEGSGSPTS